MSTYKKNQYQRQVICNQAKELDKKTISADDDNSKLYSAALDSRLLEVISKLPKHLKNKSQTVQFKKQIIS
ncbi:unnamed protein product (macronuclear) [Paramecium tetraurelia]|uniref:BESS domain-containing protein n=1 Tax=Paramecium tetraurelia TaxID=5888 RepID=A0DKK9_PARTE|nr:uncharacterized protein GSPATT00017906001 [Paramecium tetraurelia]CAK83576.1 unnamed protein product [Paramecium tetraurelia]|eukprot:XP_001450973.1 hypothetical protein (macronuclear) [Paramecium tetraurelia strain d4-2]